MAKDTLIIGIDFGTDSVRAVVIDAQSGKELGNEVAWYARWAAGKYCDPAKNMFRQHPRDYIESMESCVKGRSEKAGRPGRRARGGIGIDTTGSTPCAVDKSGTPLALKPEFAENPNAMFVLWKDHTAVKEAELINKTARGWGGTDFTKYEGGVYSSEWFWSKILHVLRADAKVRGAAFSWVEHCDWMPALLTGTTDPLTMKRSRCAAGHKAMWHAEWDGLPPEEFLVKVDPLLRGLRARLYTDTHTSDQSAGGLTAEWAKRLGPEAGNRGRRGRVRRPHGRRRRRHHGPHAGEDHGHLDLRHARGSPQGSGREVRRRHLRPGGRLDHPGHDRPGGGAVRLRRRLCVVQGHALLAAARPRRRPAKRAKAASLAQPCERRSRTRSSTGLRRRPRRSTRESPLSQRWTG